MTETKKCYAEEKERVERGNSMEDRSKEMECQLLSPSLEDIGGVSVCMIHLCMCLFVCVCVLVCVRVSMCLCMFLHV